MVFTQCGCKEMLFWIIKYYQRRKLHMALVIMMTALLWFLILMCYLKKPDLRLNIMFSWKWNIFCEFLCWLSTTVCQYMIFKWYMKYRRCFFHLSWTVLAIKDVWPKLRNSYQNRMGEIFEIHIMNRKRSVRKI